MAAFKKTEANWGSYQDKQFKFLDNIEKHLSNNFQTNYLSASKLTNIESTLKSIDNNIKVNSKNLSDITRDLICHSAELDNILGDASSSANSFKLQLQTTTNTLENFDRRVEETGNKLSSTFTNILNTIWDKLGGLKGVAANVDKFSQMSNQMIKLSGMDGSSVRGYREDIMSTVAGLNLTTGYAFSPQESYQLMVTASEGITSNLDSMREMSRSLLLTNKALDVEMSTVADLFNRFYTRYSFSSEHMEGTLDEIRGNTAGNSADAKATFENIGKLESYINLIAGNDNDLRQDLVEEVSNFTSYLENLGADSSAFTDYIYDIIGGKTSSGLTAILSHAGTSMTEAQYLARSGDFSTIAETLLKGMASIGSNYWDNGTFNYARAVENYELPVDLVNAALSIVNSENFTTLEEFLANQDAKDPSTMEGLVKDQYYSAIEKANNWLEQIYAKMASIQEFLPFGFSDIAVAIALTKGMFGGGSGGGTPGSLSRLFSRAGTNLGASGSAAGWLGAAGIAGTAAGVGMGVYGITEGVNDFKNGDEGFGLANIGGGVAGVAGAGALTAGMLGVGATQAWNPIGWGLLAAGGLTLLATNITKATSTIGSADAIEKAYDDAATTLYEKSKDQELSLSRIAEDLDEYDSILKSNTSTEEEKKRAELELAKKKKELNDLGIKTEEDNIDALKELTASYLEASRTWSQESKSILNKYKKQDTEYAYSLQGELEKYLQKINDRDDPLNKGELSSLENLFFSIKSSLDGAELDKTTQKTYDNIAKALKDGKLTDSEANSIIDDGTWNTVFQNSNLGPDVLTQALHDMSRTNGTGKSMYDSIMKNVKGKYSGGESRVMTLLSALDRLYSGRISGSMTLEEATEIFDDLKKSGYTSKEFSEISEEASAWGLQGYARGTRYVPRDQLAIVHEGEAIIPKRYNPIATAGASEDRESKELLKTFVSELQEIKQLLSEWKRDNKLDSMKSKYNRNSQFINGFMAID